MSQNKNEQHFHFPFEAIVVFCCFGLIVLVWGFGTLWYAFGYLPAFVVLCCLVTVGVGIWLYFKFSHHKREKEERKHTIDLAQAAMIAGHSVSLELPTGHKLQTISPLTIPNAPITIKDISLGQQLLSAPLPIAPAFSTLISKIRAGHLFLAQGAANAIWGDITDLLSTLDVGRPNTGKSTLLRCICAQVLIIDGKPIIFDPHGSILDDLGSSFECAESPQDIEDYSHIMDAHLTRRLKERREGRKIFKPMLLLIDEMPIIAEMAEEALPAIRRIVLEGRKVGMYALIAGQGVPAAILGGTLVRDAMASRYVFCTSPQQARMAGIENETAKSMMAILEDAGPGKAVLATSNRKPELVAIPDTTTGDIRFLLDRKRGNATETPMETPIEADPVQMGNVSGQVDDVSINESGSVGNEIRETIKRLRNRGMPLREIAPLVGMAGRKYEQFKRICDQEGL